MKKLMFIELLLLISSTVTQEIHQDFPEARQYGLFEIPSAVERASPQIQFQPPFQPPYSFYPNFYPNLQPIDPNFLRGIYPQTPQQQPAFIPGYPKPYVPPTDTDAEQFPVDAKGNPLHKFQPTDKYELEEEFDGQKGIAKKPSPKIPIDLGTRYFFLNGHPLYNQFPVQQQAVPQPASYDGKFLSDSLPITLYNQALPGQKDPLDVIIDEKLKSKDIDPENDDDYPNNDEMVLDEQKNLKESKETDDELANEKGNASTVAEVQPAAIALAGPGGVASSAPKGTALVGDGGLAVSSPHATAVAGPSKEEAQIAQVDKKIKQKN